MAEERAKGFPLIQDKRRDPPDQISLAGIRFPVVFPGFIVFPVYGV